MRRSQALKRLCQGTVAACLAALCMLPAGAQQLPAAQVWLAPGAGAKVVRMIASTPQVAARYDPTQARFSPDPGLVTLGRELFHDTRLSDPPGTSCASCHDPARAFGPDLRRGLGAKEQSPGTARGSRSGQFGQRAAPSLLYVRYVPRRYFYEDDDALVPSFFGGLMADGGAAYQVSQANKQAKVVGYDDLGMEAIYEFDVVDMPVTVAVDSGGTSAHITGPAEWSKRIASGEFKGIAVAAK